MRTSKKKPGHVIVVGGGVTGLSAAHRLQRLLPDHELTVLEESSRLGGKIHSAQEVGFVLDGGADSLLSSAANTLATDICTELGLADQLQKMRTSQLSLRKGNALYLLPPGGAIPLNPEALVESGLISQQVMKILDEELSLPPVNSTPDESVSAFARRHFGEEYSTNIAEPLLSSFHVADPKTHSMEAMYPHLRRLEERFGSLITGIKSMEKPPSPPQLMNLRPGMESLIQAVRENLTKVRVVTGTGVRSLEADEDGYHVVLADKSRLDADFVILAVPAPSVARILEDLNPTLAEAHRHIEYISVLSVSLLYDQRDIPTPMEGSGYLIPEQEGSEVYACMWASLAWENRAPEGMQHIRLFVGRPGIDPLTHTDDEVLALAKAELAQGLNIQAEPKFHQIFRWRDAYPKYDVGHLERVAIIEELTNAHPGLFLAGAAYRGFGIHDCMASANKAAQACQEHILQSGSARA